MSASEVTAEATAVHVNLRDSQSVLQEEVIASLELNKVDYAMERKKSLRARYYFGIIFLIMNLVAWFFRDYGHSVLPFIHYIKVCGSEGDDCFHSLGVLRVSLGCYIFFSVMFLTTVKTRKLCEHRNWWHSGWWEVKSVLLIVSMALPFFFPSEIVQIYGEVARIGAGIFLLLQLVSVIHFITWWTKYWTPEEERKQRCSLGLLMSTLFYVASICGIVYLYESYASRISCSLNLFFITWTVILLAAMMVISLNSKESWLLTLFSFVGVQSEEMVYLQRSPSWNFSEPATIRCETKNHEKGNSGWIIILHFPQALIQNAFSYGFFHMVFSLGAMYFAMLFISWDLNNSARKWSIDVGWISTWVKVINEWFAATIYIWMLISPVVRQNKVMDNNGTVQETADSVMA
ncbi:probable serine incorporator isoform X4 [Cajanus cajan]|uniref:probable serine incorporator isoform X4 n=1 Tax=Cajanus cajan TaxID=3821 RepID=UPI0010FAF681|nr:probable serine incorporator isoform X4 [Cajanus cajan]